jgi:hypothetical protein
VFADALAPASQVCQPSLARDPFTPTSILTIPQAAVMSVFAADGYRPAKAEGKLKLTNARQALQDKHFCKLPALARLRAFTSRSSRTLSGPSNLIGHLRPCKPANGMGT